MKRPGPRSLASIFATGLVALTTLLVGAYCIYDYAAEKGRTSQRLEELTQLQLRELRVALAEPVWNLDRAQIERVAHAMALPQSVYGVRVVAAGETFGCRRDAQWKLRGWTGGPLPPNILVYHGTIDFNGATLGNVWLFISQHLVEQSLRAFRMQLVGTVVVADVTLVLLVYLLMSFTVLEPVRSIERYAAAVSGGGQPGPPVPAAAELVRLRESIEAMVHELDLRHVELQEEMARRAESETRMISIFEAVTDAIIIREPQTGAVVDMNRRASRMFGYTPEEMRAIPIGGLSSGEHGYDVDAAARLIRQTTSHSPPHEWHVRHRDGHTFWIEVVRDDVEIAGERQVLLVARDITERRKMEEELRRAERLSAIGSLVAGIAHEVRNPLFGISATLDAFDAEFGRTPETADYMTTLHRDVARLTRLMNELLDYGSPQPLATRVQSIEPVIAEAIRVCTPAAEEKKLGIIRIVPPDLAPVTIDADRMLQVLKNVIENALEFSKGTIEIDARNDDHSVVVAITDRGPGFRSEDLPRLFEPFFTRRRGGTGLGLAIVQKIVAEHGGEVTATNAAAGGARVEIRLPVAEAVRARA